MSGPPKDQPPSELFRKLTEIPRPTTEIDFPVKGTDGKSIGRCKLWILKESELHVARAQADMAAREIMGQGAPKGTETSWGYEDIYRNELAVQLVTMSCRTAEDPRRPVFWRAKDARQNCTTDELTVLANAYNEFRVQAGPLLTEMSPDDMEAWLKRLQEGAASTSPLFSWDGAMLRQFIRFLISKIQTSSTDSGSAGSPQNDTSVADVDQIDPSEKAQPE